MMGDDDNDDDEDEEKDEDEDVIVDDDGDIMDDTDPANVNTMTFAMPKMGQPHTTFAQLWPSRPRETPAFLLHCLILDSKPATSDVQPWAPGCQELWNSSSHPLTGISTIWAMLTLKLCRTRWIKKRVRLPNEASRLK